MNYYYQESEKTRYGQVILHPLFDNLASYLNEHSSERIILRQLHERFSEKDFEKFLDKLISLELVTRENRQYRLGFPIFEDVDESEISKTVSQLIDEVQQIPLENQAGYIGEVIWHKLFPYEAYFYGVSHKEEFYTKSVAGNQTIQLVSIALREQPPVTLPNYFSLIRQQQMLPSSFDSLSEMIGDVNEIYFFNQVEMILEKMENGRLRTRRRNIFLESLIKTGVVTEPHFQLDWPVVQSEGVMNRINLETPFVNISGETIEEKAYKSHIIFKKLLKGLGISNLVYLKK